jgi:hypothetical protein
VAKVHVTERGAENALMKFRCEVEGERVCVGQAEYRAVVGESR